MFVFKKLQTKKMKLSRSATFPHILKNIIYDIIWEQNSVIFVATASTEVWTVSSRTLQQDKQRMCRIDKNCPRWLTNDRGIAG